MLGGMKSLSRESEAQMQFREMNLLLPSTGNGIWWNIALMPRKDRQKIE